MRRREARDGRIQSVEALLSRALPRQYTERLRLEKVAAEWKRVVGPLLGGQSVPFDLVGGELLVAADTPLVAKRLAMMGGNIARTLASMGLLEVEKVKVVIGRGLPKPASAGNASPRPVSVRVAEEEVRELERLCLEQAPDIPEDAAESLARLQAFYAKRFRRGKNPRT